VHADLAGETFLTRAKWRGIKHASPVDFNRA
jgi:hypothetical protein